MAVEVGVDSYIDEAELTAYAAKRGITLTTATSALLYKAMDVCESKSYLGAKTSASQDLQWPRSGVYIDGVLIDSATTPQQMKDAQAVVAISIDQGYDPLATYGPAVKRKKVDVLETEYQDGAASTKYNPNITRAFAKLVAVGSGSGSIPIYATR